VTWGDEKHPSRELKQHHSGSRKFSRATLFAKEGRNVDFFRWFYNFKKIFHAKL
jgi:hypothetical protein